MNEDAITELSRKVDELQMLLQTLGASTVKKLSLQPGDILHLQLGDIQTGALPTPETEKRILELFKTALGSQGLINTVVVSTSYQVTPTIV